MEASQPAGDMSNPPVDELVLIQNLTPGIHQNSDFAAGRFEERSARGALFLVPANTATNIEVFNRHRIRVLAIDRTTIGHAFRERSKAVEDFGPLHRGSFRDDGLSALFDAVWHVAQSEMPEAPMQAQSALLLALDRRASLAGKQRPSPKGGLAPWQLRRIEEALREAEAGTFSLAQLADIVGLSPFHFCRAFKEATGLPPHAYQRTLQLEHARHALEEDSRSVTEIAMALGYGSSQAFARAFRRETGMSPSQYRLSRMR
ncbi:helix-turn-helix transcriptional regulator [Qipengyuania qiaonensis]|uniref:AraC family transcriptional regulator n=1 Tax=Qipengyuania qiaonensis TaxID=2867240 RepID=A0ABS7J305_9SPHN|nr:AraC family transcriptional regulator [Qipengyuania qiaonensis]MBX7481706.1 AraC family transcriptional regulator [Qipengyuania qiaonensis]